MPPVIPVGILAIIAAASVIGVLGGVVAFFITEEGTGFILAVCFVVIFFLLIPFFPNRYQFVRDFKRKLRHVLDDEN